MPEVAWPGGPVGRQKPEQVLCYNHTYSRFRKSKLSLLKNG